MTHAKTYLFYDLETTGQSRCFDQVLQFAAIRTDTDLVELDRYHIRVRLNCDVIPSPSALLVHRIPVAASQADVSEFEAMAKIHQILNTPHTQSGGYNTLGFDDEVLRFSFHRNLLPPYTHQWANGCGRFDIYPVVQLYYLYHPDSLHWPTSEKQAVSLKLEALNQRNALHPGKAHDAMVDVEATLALARVLRTQKETWDYALATFDKKTDLARCAKLKSCLTMGAQKYTIALLLGCASSADFFQFPALNLGRHYHYQNQHIWLRLDTPDLVQTTPDTITEHTAIARLKPAERIILPFTGRFKQHLTAKRLAQTDTNLAWLSENPTGLQAIVDYYLNAKYPEIKGVDPEAGLYLNAFLAPQEQHWCKRFHAASPHEKVQLLQHTENRCLKELALRILGRNYADALPDSLKTQFNHYRDNLLSNTSKTPIDWKGEKRRTAQSVLAELAQLQKTDSNASDQLLLQGLEAYVQSQCEGN